MKSTNLYSGLVVVLAAAATTALGGCAVGESADDAIETESSVESVSSPCNDGNSKDSCGDESGGAPSSAPSGTPCNGSGQGSYGPPQGGYGPPQGGYGPPQGGYGPPQGGYGSPQGGYEGGVDEGAPMSGVYYNKSVTYQSYGAPGCAGGGGIPGGGYDLPYGDDVSPYGGGCSYNRGYSYGYPFGNRSWGMW